MPAKAGLSRWLDLQELQRAVGMEPFMELSVLNALGRAHQCAVKLLLFCLGFRHLASTAATIRSKSSPARRPASATASDVAAS
jgi:hypothetical protein